MTLTSLFRPALSKINLRLLHQQMISALILSVLLCALTPSQARDRATSSATSSGIPISGASISDTPSSTRASSSNGLRLAQNSNAGAASNMVSGDGLPSQGVLPVDLGQVRRVTIAGTGLGDTPMRVGNLDVLAPFVDQLSGLGASASRVSKANMPPNNTTPEDQLFQINLSQGSPIVLTVGKAVAYVDQQPQPLRAAPLVIKDKIWLPIYSLAPLMSAAPRLAPDGTLQLNPTILSVELFPVHDTTVLTVKASAPIKSGGVLMGVLDNPDKIYLDFPGYSMGFDASYSTNEKVISGEFNDVARVRGGLFKKFPDTTRVVLDLKKGMRGAMQPLPDKTVFALLLSPKFGTLNTDPVPATLSLPDGTLRGLTIVVDAGHGGHDNGAGGSKSREKDHTLDISRRLRTYLQKRGANVLMTRDDDNFISLQGRCDFANTRNADLFISVHINSFRANSTGTETYYYTGQSGTFAREVHKELLKATGLRDRGVIQKRFFVVRNTNMPSVLTETCFISNPGEENKLLQPSFRDQVARGMAQGIQNYADKYIRNASAG